MANPVVNRICPSLQELAPNSNRNHISSYAKHRSSTAKKSEQVPKTCVVSQFHCPVQGCIYDGESARYFTHLTYLRQHVKKVHSPKVHSCQLCNKGFAVVSDLSRHTLVCGSVFCCTTCGIQYSSREALLTHAKRKQHLIDDNQRPRKSASLSASDTIKKLDENVNFKNRSLVLVVSTVNNEATNDKPMTTKAPRLILPKPEPPTGKWIAQLTTDVALNTVKEAVDQMHQGVQTESTKHKDVEKGSYPSCGNCKKRSSGVFILKKRKLVNSKTQTKTTSIHVRVKSTQKTRLLKDEASQTESELSVTVNRMVENTTTQTESSWDFREGTSSPTIPDSVFIPEYAFGNGNHHMWSYTPTNTATNTNKCIQTIEDLDVETRFPMSPGVTASTQTSPRCQPINSSDLCSSDRMLDSPLNKLFGIDLGHFHDFNHAFPASSKYPNSPLLATDSSVKLLSSETQTDQHLINCLNLDDADQSDSELDIGETMSYDIHTQTPKDLEAIPYDQLLTNMETQTSDPFLFSALLCDIETQTAVLRHNESVGLVDTHTQTNCNLAGRLDTHLADMETQTLFNPQLESELMDVHTQTPGSWLSLFDIFNEY